MVLISALLFVGASALTFDFGSSYRTLCRTGQELGLQDWAGRRVCANEFAKRRRRDV